MSVLPDRLTVPLRFGIRVTCAGRAHWLEVNEGRVRAADHPTGRPADADCVMVLNDLHAEQDVLAHIETEILRERVSGEGPTLFDEPTARATTTVMPVQLRRLSLLRATAADAAFRPDPERFFTARTRFIADQVFGTAPWVVRGGSQEGRVLVADDWLASVFVPGLEVVNGLPVSAVRQEDGDLFFLTLIAEDDGTIHSHELDWLDAELPQDLVLL